VLCLKRIVEIIVRLVVGHLTEGYRGQPEGSLYTYIPAVIEAVNSRELLQSPTYPAALDGLGFNQLVLNLVAMVVLVQHH
jgi:hypothetical protein